jgi:hypothetical protein
MRPNARLTGAHKAYPERCEVSASELNLQLGQFWHEVHLRPESGTTDLNARPLMQLPDCGAERAPIVRATLTNLA